MFKIGYNLVLNMIGIGLNSKSDCVSYASKSMVSRELNFQARTLETQIDKLKVNSEVYTRTPFDIIQEYIDLGSMVKLLVNKKRKECERKICTIKDEYKFIDQDLVSYQAIKDKQIKSNELVANLDSTTNFMGSNVDQVLHYLESKGFIHNLEKLKQQQLGTSFNWNTEKGFSLNGIFTYINNDFTGSAASPVGFQLLEGLQNGKNTTWQLLFQKNITQFLDVSINYNGRKSETSNTIHIGSVQLRAYF